MDDVYLLNNPFTFQAMEKHSAYVAMMRLGLKVPATWMVPHKSPTPIARFDYMAEKFADVASKYNAPFDLREIGEQIGYPLYMKPFDGGQWVGVTRVSNADELQARYDESGERLMHLQAAVDFDVFVRSLSIGAETISLHFSPDAPMHERYTVKHDFLTPEVGRRGRDDLTARERVLPLGVQLLRDAREGRRGASDRLRERVAGRRVDVAALLLPVGDEDARQVVRVLRRDRAADAHLAEHARLLRRSATATICRTRRSSTSTAGSRTRSCRSRSTRSSARSTSRTSTRSRSSTSRRRSSTGCSSRP